MKSKIQKILGVGLTLVLATVLAVGIAVPISAADYDENEWGEWGLPDTDEETDIGPIAVAPDGTLYAAVFYWDDDNHDGVDDVTDGDLADDGIDEWWWDIQKSEDNGYSWDETELELLAYWEIPVSIVMTQNYEDDELVYVGTYDGPDGPVVYRLEEFGEGDVVALKDFPEGATMPENVDELFCIDVFDDDGDIWILAATEEDVFVLLDDTFEPWREQELDSWTGTEGVTDYDFVRALEVAFAPDFEDSDLIYAVVEAYDGIASNDFWLVSTVSPGKWGQEIGDAWIDEDASEWLDMDFPDDYSSDPDDGPAIVWLGLTDDAGPGAVWMVEGVDADDGNSNAINMFDLAGEVDVDIVSIAVSGDYGDEYILAGELNSGTVWISDDSGTGWDAADKNPTGDGWTHVIMEADIVWGGGLYDPEESMSFAATFGDESAISRADPNEDGDLNYNQVGLIDTVIDKVNDIAIHPDFPDETVFLLLTCNGVDTDSLWLTENGDDDEPDYIRVLCGSDPDVSEVGNFDTEGLWLVEFSQGAEAIYIFGEDEDGDQSVWKSTDDGQSFGSERDVKDDAWINDWVITDAKTIYAATDKDGFYLSTNSGLSWTGTDLGGEGNDIALSPDFDDGEGYILIGGDAGDIYLSDNDGDTFGDAEKEEKADLTNEVFVAFDADFADEDADGYMFIYAASQGEVIQEGEVADTDDVDWGDLEDGDDEALEMDCEGLQVAEDNALYAIGLLEEEEVEVETVTVTGTIDIIGTDLLSTGNDDGVVIDEVEVDVLSDDFTDGEDADVAAANLEAESATVVSGTVFIEGATSGALGSFGITILTDGGYVPGEDVAVDAYDFDTAPDGIDVTIDTEAEATGVARLLLHETNNEWESASDSDLVDPEMLWLSPGSNVLWTIDWDDAEFWLLEDTLSGSPTLSAPPDDYKSDEEEQMRISWDEMRGIDEDYEFKWTNVDPDYTKKDWTDETSILLTDLSATSEYEWKVRAAAQSRGDDNSDHDTWSSRWSGKWTFFTALGEPPWAPTLYTPGGVWQYSGIDVELMPAFSWESAKTADSYTFVLADNATFTSPLVNEQVPESAYQLDFELEYNTNYFWRVQAYKGTESISRVSDVGAFTTISAPAPAPPAPPEPGPPVEIIQTEITPLYIWVIIVIGAALVIAVIVLIVRTRRPL